MQIISDLQGFLPDWQSCALTMGDFDGLHAGHRNLIEKTIEESEKINIPSVILTYDPSPKKILQKLRFDTQIYTREEKTILLQDFFLRAAVFLPFNQEIALMPADKFLNEIILTSLKTKYLIIGYDHHFGKNREGNFQFLTKAAKENFFSVKKVEPVYIGDTLVSSSEIRRLLNEGNIEKANILLTAPYLIIASVIRGRQRGQKFGIPTANLHIVPEKLLPKEGVYFGAAVYGKNFYKTVINIGFKPTFENVDLTVEAHLLNFNEKIYGKILRVYFLKRIRDEIKFANIDALKHQIEKDIQTAQKIDIPKYMLKKIIFE
ncbi:MAG: bifunctional riboflavin kinase/FAD synthetase [Spirochaetia bacterium]|nr:bifunctional riboflavin kinase/FAD synthetase [Spirochaetia bacterium]